MHRSGITGYTQYVLKGTAYKRQLILATHPILGKHEVPFKGQAYEQFHGVPYKTYCV